MGPDEMVGKKKRKAKNWSAGSETISRSRMPKMTSRLRNVTYEIPRNPSWAPGIAIGRNRAPTRGSRVNSSAAGKGQYQEVRVRIQRKAWATIHWKTPQAITTQIARTSASLPETEEPPVTPTPSGVVTGRRCAMVPYWTISIAAVASKTHAREKPSHRRISKVGRAMYRRMPK